MIRGVVLRRVRRRVLVCAQLPSSPPPPPPPSPPLLPSLLSPLRVPSRRLPCVQHTTGLRYSRATKDFLLGGWVVG